jgi:hypothetical protein
MYTLLVRIDKQRGLPAVEEREKSGTNSPPCETWHALAQKVCGRNRPLQWRLPGLFSVNVESKGALIHALRTKFDACAKFKTNKDPAQLRAFGVRSKKIYCFSDGHSLAKLDPLKQPEESCDEFA